MMPRFTNGKVESYHTVEMDSIILKDKEGKVMTIRMRDLFMNVVGDEDVRYFAGKKILTSDVKDMKEWFRFYLKKREEFKEVKSISVIKQDITYYYDYYSFKKIKKLDSLLFKIEL